MTKEEGYIPHRTEAVDSAIMMEDIRRLISEGKSVTIRVKGYSMNPFLMHLRDFITLGPWKEENLRKGTVALVKDNRGRYLIHRIIKIEEKTVTLLGDGNVRLYEKATKDNIIAVAKGFQRNGKEISTDSLCWKIYSWIWMAITPIKRWPLGLWRRLNPQPSLNQKA